MSLSSFGPLPAPLTTRLTSLSTAHSLTPTQLYETWEAYSLTKNLATLDDNNINGFESHIRNMHKAKGVAVLANSSLGKRTPMAGVTPSPAPKRDRSGLSAVDSLEGQADAADHARTPSKSAASTPSSSAKSITVTPQKVAAAYASRNGRGSTVVAYNPHNLDPISVDGGAIVNITTHPSSEAPSQRHGFAPLVSRAKSLEDRWDRMNTALCTTHNLRSEEEDMVVCAEGGDVEQVEAYWTPVGVPGQSEVVCVGRICNEVSTLREWFCSC